MSPDDDEMHDDDDEMHDDDRICEGCCGIFDQSEINGEGYCCDCSVEGDEL